VTAGIWRWLSQTTLLNVPPWLEVVRESVELPDGRRLDDYYSVKMPSYVVVVALTADGMLVAERHYRPALRKVSVTVPAGYLVEGEDPLNGAQRELREETGYEASLWTSLGEFVVDGNRGCGTAHFFLAQQARRVADPDGRDLAEMMVELIEPAAFLASLRSGGPHELATAAALGLALLELQH
jgi:ADP-ribose pyrophosphatase